MLAKVKKFTDLSFVESAARPWAPARTGNYEHDCAQGRRYADELVDFIREKNDPHAYGRIVKAMSANHRIEGVEIGFCNRIGIHLIGLPARGR